jgi:hypothetical protein
MSNAIESFSPKYAQPANYRRFEKNGDPTGFQTYLDKISKTSSNFNKICNNAISWDYFKTNMKPKATHIWAFERKGPRGGIVIISVLIGFFIKERKEFYIDLLCSNKESYFGHKALGVTLMDTVINDLKKEGVSRISLRAAQPWHVGYYQKKGFVRAKDACTDKEGANIFEPIKNKDKLELAWENDSKKYILPNKYAAKNIKRETDEEECDFVEEGKKGSKANCWLSDGYWMSKCILTGTPKSSPSAVKKKTKKKTPLRRSKRQQLLNPRRSERQKSLKKKI